MCRRAPVIRLSREEKDELQRLAKAFSTPQGLVFRCRVVLRCAKVGRPTNGAVAEEFDCDPGTVGKWRSRFAARRLEGLADLPRCGAPRAFSPGRPA